MRNFWNVTDSLKLDFKAPRSHFTKHKFSNIWIHFHCANVLLVFALHRKIRVLFTSMPGEFSNHIVASYITCVLDGICARVRGQRNL